MSKLQKAGIFALGLLLGTPLVALAINITVPSSPGSGFFLISTTTGAYTSTTSDPAHFGSIFAPSTTASSFIRYASTTQTSAVSFCLTGDSCRTTWPSASSVWPFTPDTYGGVANNSTTTPLWLKNTMILASTTLFTNASTTLFTASNAWITYATTTQVSATSLCLTGDTCRTTWPTGGSLWPFTPDTYNGVANNSTTTPLWLKNTMVIASTTYFTNASTTGLTVSGNEWHPNLTAMSLLATNVNGLMIASSTIGNNQLAFSSLTVNSTAPLTGGGAVSLGGTLTLACATCNTFGWPFTSDTYNSVANNSTTTPLWLKNTMILASTTLFTNASTTLLTATYASSTAFSASNALFAQDGRVYGKQDKSFAVASSTLAYSGWSVGTSTYIMWNPQRAITITDLYCKGENSNGNFVAGTSTVAVGSGAATSSVLCGGQVAGSATGLTISVAARGNVIFQFGGAAGTADYFTPTISFTSP